MTKRERRWWHRKNKQKQLFIHISTPGICEECGKQADGLMTCYYAHDESTIDLCPTCLKEDGSFCMSCGQFCSGMASFDFIHPGYCDNCWDEIIEADDWNDTDGFEPYIEYPFAEDADAENNDSQ